MRTKARHLECEDCGAEVQNVSNDAVSVKCWMCTLQLISKQVIEDETIDGTTDIGQLQPIDPDN